MNKLGNEMTEQEVTEMFKEADLDGDGALNKEEFMAVMKQ